MQNWNLNVQHQLSASTVVSLAYAGSKGTHLIRSRDLNQPPPGPGPVFTRRPYPQFGSIFFSESSGNSDFHALEASINRRLAHNFSVLAAYTFSKSIDDTSAFLGSLPDKNFPQDSSNYHAERALSSYDMRHRFTTAYVYHLPGRAWWVRNSEVRGITVAQSGQPFTPVLRADNSNTGNTGGIFGSDRPDLLRDPRLDHPTPARWFDTSAFAIAPPYHFGSAGPEYSRRSGSVHFRSGALPPLRDPRRREPLVRCRSFQPVQSRKFRLAATDRRRSHDVWQDLFRQSATADPVRSAFRILTWSAASRPARRKIRKTPEPWVALR